MEKKKNLHPKISEKDLDLEANTSESTDQFLTTNQGLRINDDQNSLKAGERGATLLEDFILREKITHFDHERIPERVVHARGAAAHGFFELDKSLAKFTKAKFLTDISIQTPVFVRFSTVAGSRGSSDLARDVRGFAVKFYTQEGIFDLVGNNMPVFFIQDAIKFPDLIHAVKPEPHNEIPQASSAHDTFWDFISLMPESMHMIMWVMSDRALPRSFRMMEGFGVHTLRLINEKGESVFVKFHWKPLLGVHSVAWDEAQQISGKNPDFHREDLYDAIENGNYPEWELGVQIILEKDEHAFNFDLLDPTKLVPEELVPVMRIGKMTLNRNPDNFFAETEQVAFHPGHLVPGIDFTNDPLLQGRLFSYTDTQLSRLGSSNFHEIPINRSIAPVHNNQRDGHMRQTIDKGKVANHPNTVGMGCPFQAKMKEGGFTSMVERIDAKKIRGRSSSFFDHFSQATLFYHSQSENEKNHIIKALRFELSKVSQDSIRSKMLNLLNFVDKTLAAKVSEAIGVAVPTQSEPIINHSYGADTNPASVQPHMKKATVTKSSALSMENTIKDSIKTRKIAILTAAGVDIDAVLKMKKTLEEEGATVKIIAPHLGDILAQKKKNLKPDENFLTSSSVLFDAVYVPGTAENTHNLLALEQPLDFIEQALKHCKAVAFDESSKDMLAATKMGKKLLSNPLKQLKALGVLIEEDAKEFVKAIAKHRFWDRENL